MAESSVPGLGDVLAMFGGTNPFAVVGKSIDQFKRGVEGFLSAVENFNKTMETLNGVAERVSALLDDVEEPVRAFVPQLTRSIKATEAMINQLSGPVERVAPGLARLGETLSSPIFANMPNEIGAFLDTIGDLAGRMQPLAQMAENAGSLFGLRPFSGLRNSGSGRGPDPAPARPSPPPPPVALAPAPAAKSPAKRTPAKRMAAKKSPAKKSPVKKSPAKKRA